MHEATAVAQDFADSHRLPGVAAARLAIIVEELVANLVEHGGLTPHCRIDLSLVRTSDGVRLTLSDPGLPFDPRDLHALPTVNEERGGGAGLALVRSWTSELTYASAGGRNRLELLLPVPGPVVRA